MPVAFKQSHGASARQPQALQTTHVCHFASPIVGVDLRLAAGVLDLCEVLILHQPGIDVALRGGKEACWMELAIQEICSDSSCEGQQHLLSPTSHDDHTLCSPPTCTISFIGGSLA